jgi:hypothetical protein
LKWIPGLISLPNITAGPAARRFGLRNEAIAICQIRVEGRRGRVAERKHSTLFSFVLNATLLAAVLGRRAEEGVKDTTETTRIIATGNVKV